MVNDSYNETHAEYNDDINFTELITNLWNQKWIIVIATLATTILAFIHAFKKPLVYKASTQIKPPFAAELEPINNTQLITITSEEAFASLLSHLESDSHKAQFVQEETELLAKIYGKPTTHIQLESINFDNLYTISYPRIQKQTRILKPDIYTLSTEGTDREHIKLLLDRNVALATKELVNQWKEAFTKTKTAQLENNENNFDRLSQIAKTRRDNTIIRLEEENALKVKKLGDELAARKKIVLKNRNNLITELEEALKIANALNLTQPSSLSRMATQQTSSQVEVNTEIRDQQDPLYLRGSNLIQAELDSLKKLPNTTFLDSRVIELETELQKLSNNRDIEILKARENDIAFNEELQDIKENIQRLRTITFPENFSIYFQNTPAVSPFTPIKPRKRLIVAVGFAIGAVLGLLIAIGRIVYRNYSIKN